MRPIRTKLLMIGILVLSGVAHAGEKVVRATDLGTTMQSGLTNGGFSNVIIEFRQGDELPMTLEVQGDLAETTQASVSRIGIKKNFWIRLSQNNLEISLDGTTFKKLNELLTGSLQAGAGSAQNGGVADAISIIFKAFQK